MSEKLTFTINNDFRCFKKGQALELPLYKSAINYIVGPNGSGKSSLMHFIRAKRHDLFSENKSMYDGMISRDDRFLKDSDDITIDGLDSFDQIFVLDVVDDDPLSFNNAATASGLIGSGGLAMLEKSRGQKSQMLSSRFINSIVKVTGFSIQDFNNGKRYDKHPLIIVDELDEGLDINNQSKFSRLLLNLGTIFNATVICICHNFFCIACDEFTGKDTTVWDISDGKIKTIKKYVLEQTGFEIDINPAKNES